MIESISVDDVGWSGLECNSIFKQTAVGDAQISGASELAPHWPSSIISHHVRRGILSCGCSPSTQGLPPVSDPAHAIFGDLGTPFLHFIHALHHRERRKSPPLVLSFPSGLNCQWLVALCHPILCFLQLSGISRWSASSAEDADDADSALPLAQAPRPRHPPAFHFPDPAEPADLR